MSLTRRIVGLVALALVPALIGTRVTLTASLRSVSRSTCSTVSNCVLTRTRPISMARLSMRAISSTTGIRTVSQA